MTHAALGQAPDTVEVVLEISEFRPGDGPMVEVHDPAAAGGTRQCQFPPGPHSGP